MKTHHRVYTSRMPLGGPLEPWIVRMRQLEENLQIELGGRVAHAMLSDSLGNDILLARAEMAVRGRSGWLRV